MSGRVLPFKYVEGPAPIEGFEDAGFEDDRPIEWVGQTKMQEAVARLKELGVRYRLADENTIRIGVITYYPVRGTIMRDGFGRAKHKGLDHLVKVLVDLNAVPGRRR